MTALSFDDKVFNREVSFAEYTVSKARKNGKAFLKEQNFLFY